MTRGEEIKCESKDYINYLLDKQEYHNENYTEYDIQQAFEKGAQWADNNPKSPWISVKDKLPCNEKDLIVEIIKGVELRTKKVGVLSIDGYIDISYMYSLPPHGWHWNTNDTITHWFPLPERPKNRR